MTVPDSVVTVDRSTGSCEKVAAHRHPGVLHRAFSVLLFDGESRLLLQQRAASKYHFRSRWSNSCCGHPRPGEDLVAAARRRVREELGLVVDLSRRGWFQYRAVDLDSGLVEHELDHVLVGCTDDPPRPAAEEIDGLCWATHHELVAWLADEPEAFTPWFLPALRAAAGSGDLRLAFPTVGVERA